MQRRNHGGFHSHWLASASGVLGVAGCDAWMLQDTPCLSAQCPLSTMRWLTILVLLLINVAYVYIGGAVFYWVEGNSQQQQVSLDSLIDNFLDAGVEMNHTRIADLVMTAIEANDQGKLTGPFSNSARLGILWDYQNSVFFTATIVTSIGYGYLAPRTDTGRYLCLVFACLGIPLFMTFISLLGDKLNSSTHWLTHQGFLKNRESVGKIIRLLFFILVGSVLFLLLPAYCFTLMEQWSFQDSLYYGFVTLSTIGFGDYVAGTNRSIDYPDWYQFLRTMWIYTGLAWLAMVVRLQQDALGVFVRARESDVISIAVKTSKRIHASILKRLVKSSPTMTEDNHEASWLEQFQTPSTNSASSVIGMNKRKVLRTRSAPISEEKSMDDLQGQLDPNTANNRELYVEHHDNFVIECNEDKERNVITIDRQNQISSPAAPSDDSGDPAKDPHNRCIAHRDFQSETGILPYRHCPETSHSPSGLEKHNDSESPTDNHTSVLLHDSSSTVITGSNDETYFTEICNKSPETINRHNESKKLDKLTTVIENSKPQMCNVLPVTHAVNSDTLLQHERTDSALINENLYPVKIKTPPILERRKNLLQMHKFTHIETPLCDLLHYNND